eukprot:gene6412-8826_t
MDKAWYSLALIISSLVSTIRTRDPSDELARKGVVDAKELISFTKVLQYTPYPRFQQKLVFVDVLTLMMDDSTDLDEKKSQCMGYLQEIFNEPSLLIVIADIYHTISMTLSRQGKAYEALEFAGRDLLTRVSCLGAHPSTADSHLRLGILYRAVGNYEQSLQELQICKALRCKLGEELSVEVSTCEMQIGLTNSSSTAYYDAYVSFYRSFRTRCLLLGHDHSLTAEVEELMLIHRNVNGERIISSLELKDRVNDLDWNSADSHTPHYTASIFVGRLNDDDVHSFRQIKNLVTNAVNFSFANLSSSGSKSESINDMIDGLTLLLATISKPKQLKTLSSPSPSIGIKKRFIIPVQEEKLSINHPKNNINNSNNSNDLRKTNKNTDEIKTNKSSLNKSLTRIEEVIVPSNLSYGRDMIDGNDIIEYVTPIKQITLSSNSPFESPQQSKFGERSKSISNKVESELDVQKIIHYKQQNNQQLHNNNNNNNTKFQPLPFSISNKPFIFARDMDGALVCIQPATAQCVIDKMKNKLFQVTLFPWLAKNHHKLDHHKPQKHEDKINSESLNSDTKLLLSNLFTKKLPSRDNTTSSDTTNNDNNIKNNDDVTINIPMPPPLPTCWPPIPYMGDELSLSANSTSFNDVQLITQAVIPSGPKLKQLYLEGLKENITNNGTLWNESADVNVPTNILFDDLEEEFAIGLARSKNHNSQFSGHSTLTASKTMKRNLSAAETLLDAQRGNNINIMLSKFGKRNLHDIAQAVSNFDADALGLAAVVALSQFIPTPDEIAKVTAYVKKHTPQTSSTLSPTQVKSISSSDAIDKPNNPLSPLNKNNSDSIIDMKAFSELKLGKPEQYIYIFSKVDKLEKKILALNCWLSIPETCQIVKNNAETMLRAVNEVKGSGKLKFILKAFLELGNTLSKGMKSGSSPLIGIKLSSLNKINQTKTNSGDPADVYVVQKILQHFPEALDLSADMPTAEEAKGIILSRMINDMKKLEDGIGLMKELIDKNNDSTGNSGASTGGTTVTCGGAGTGMSELGNLHLIKCYEESIKQYTQASKSLQESLHDFKDLCCYFGDDDIIDAETFFGYIVGFIKTISAATIIAISKAKRKAKLMK